MRIVHLSTSSSGGAGIAASRLSSLLAKDGVETKLITRDSAAKSPNWLSNSASKTAGKLVTQYQKWISISGRDLVTPLSVGQLSLGEIYEFNPDVVHIHNWYNHLSISDLKILGERFPLVFTLHDERLLTGGCHMTLGCNQFLTGCVNCPAVSRNKSLIASKKEELSHILQRIPKYGVITPSVWLLNQAVKSRVAGGTRPIQVIPNVISSGESVTKKQYKSEALHNLKLLFVAADLSAHVKDLRLALAAIANYVSDDLTDLIVELHVVGNNFPAGLENQTGFKLNRHGYMSEIALSNLMLEMDALLITSRSENSPNIIAEAQFRGLLVIARESGGIAELIIDGERGFLTNSTAASIADGFQRFISLKDKQLLSDNAVIFANKYWDQEEILAKHKDFYLQLLRMP